MVQLVVERLLSIPAHGNDNTFQNLLSELMCLMTAFGGFWIQTKKERSVMGKVDMDMIF